MGPFVEQFKGYKNLIVALVFLVWILYFILSLPDSTIHRPPGPRAASKSACKPTEYPSHLSFLPQELANLTHLLYWPPTPGDEGDLLASTSPQTSTYHLRGPAQASCALGGFLEVILVARDHQGRPKTHSEDLFWAQQLTPDVKVGSLGMSRFWRMAHTCCPSLCSGLEILRCKSSCSTPTRQLEFFGESEESKGPQ